MLKIKCDINQQYLKTVDLHFVKSEYSLLTWSCGSRQRDTTSSGWKFRLNNLAGKGLSDNQIGVYIIRIGFTKFYTNDLANWKEEHYLRIQVTHIFSK